MKDELIRKETVRARLLRVVEEGMFDPIDIIEMFVNWSTNDDIDDMLRANDINIRSNLFN